MGNSQDKGSRIVEVATGFYNIRASFKVKGLIDIGTHMSLSKLSNGKFLVIDTVPFDDELKKEFDVLTNNGTNIEAVVATHPFHTLAFPPFYKMYPNLTYYGTPRHIRNQKEIIWAGNIMNELNRWQPDVQMRIPEGSEFIAPQPEKTNHFNSVWVYHPSSRVLHVDDTLMYFENPSFIFKLIGKKPNVIEFHPSMKYSGLYPTEEAPYQFKRWVEQILQDWDFDTVCCAHIGVKQGGAHELLREALKNAEPEFEKLAQRNAGKHSLLETDEHDCSQHNVEGTNECG
jgi:hypothetical protein